MKGAIEMRLRCMSRYVAFVAVVLSVGSAGAYGYIPGEVVLVPFAAPMAIAWCGMETNPPPDSIRARKNVGILEREGLAIARVLTSPLNLLAASYGMEKANKTAGNRTKFDQFAATPTVGVISILYGACGTVDEILVGVFEMLTTLKVNQVYYPWETYRVSCKDMTKLLTPEPKKTPTAGK